MQQWWGSLNFKQLQEMRLLDQNNLLKLKNIPKDRIRINKMRVGKPVDIIINPAFHFHGTVVRVANSTLTKL